MNVTTATDPVARNATDNAVKDRQRLSKTPSDHKLFQHSLYNLLGQPKIIHDCLA